MKEDGGYSNKVELNSESNTIVQMVVTFLRVFVSLVLVFATSLLLSLLTVVVVRQKYMPKQVEIIRPISLDFTRDIPEGVVPISFTKQFGVNIEHSRSKEDESNRKKVVDKMDLFGDATKDVLPLPFREVGREESLQQQYRILNIGMRDWY